MNLYYNFLQSTRHIGICAQSACHTVYHVNKYAQSYGGGVFSGEKKVLR